METQSWLPQPKTANETLLSSLPERLESHSTKWAALSAGCPGIVISFKTDRGFVACTFEGRSDYDHGSVGRDVLNDGIQRADGRTEAWQRRGCQSELKVAGM